jgi:hypothetical protein
MKTNHNRTKAPGKAEVQLQLTNEEMFSGKAGMIDFLTQGIRIQEAQYGVVVYNES